MNRLPDLKLNEIKSTLRAVLISSAKALSQEQVDKDFKMFVGFNIPYRNFGHPTLESFLRSMPDVVKFEGHLLRSVVTSQTAHLSALVMKNRPPQKHRSASFVTPTNTLKNIPDNYFKEKSTGMGSDGQHHSPLSPGNLIVPSKVQFMLYKILIKHRKGINLKDIETLINSKYPLKSFDIPSAQKLVERVPHLAKMSNGLVYLAEVILLENRDKLQDNTFPKGKYNNPCISFEIVTNFQKILDENPNGVWCSDMPLIYWEKFDAPLSYHTYGYSSMVEMAGDLPEVFHVVWPKNEDYLLLDGRKNLPSHFSDDILLEMNSDLHDDDFFDSLEDLENFVMKRWRLWRQFFSPYEAVFLTQVVGSYSEICQPTIPTFLSNLEYQEVLVGDIINPLCFWMQLYDLDRRNDLKALASKMHSFYVSQQSRYNIPKVAIKPDQMCAYRHNYEWRRARILKPCNLEETELFYIDYGTKSTARAVGLRFLVEKFSALPAQAIRCSLANIKPSKNQDKWTPSACERFLQMVTERPEDDLLPPKDLGRKRLLAMIMSFIPLGRSFTCALLDTSGDQDFHINDNLVREGHADFIH